MSTVQVRPEGEIFRDKVVWYLLLGSGENYERLMENPLFILLKAFLEDYQDVDADSYLNPSWVEFLRPLLEQQIPLMRTNTTKELVYAYLVFKEGREISNQWRSYLSGRDGETYFSVVVEEGTVPVNIRTLIRYFEGSDFDNWLGQEENENENEFEGEEDDSDE